MSLLALLAAASAAGHARAAEPPRAGPVIEVVVRQGRLSVNLHDAPLADVLRLIGREAGLTLHLDGSFRAPITLAFADAPLESGIRRLTRGHSSTFAYAPAAQPGGATRLAEIWVIESTPARASGTPLDLQARARGLARVASLGRRSDDGAIADLHRIVTGDPDPVIRARATRALGRPGDARATPALTAALGDQEPSVRIQAVRGLQRVAGEGAADALGRVLLADPDPSVRRAAAWALAGLGGEGAGSALRAAMTADGDASVRRAATAAFRRWEQRGQRPPGR